MATVKFCAVPAWQPPPSVFSPHRASPRGSVLAVSPSSKRCMLHDMPDVPHEVLVSILVFLWRSDEYAPRMAAVSRCWARASADAEAQLKHDVVAPHRPYVKLSVKAPLEPALSAEDKEVHEQWGAELENYSVIKIKESVRDLEIQFDRRDMLSVLDQDNDGQLYNVAIDAYLETLMPSAFKASPGERCVFLPGAASERASAGTRMLGLCDYAPTLRLAEEIYSVWHIPNKASSCQHWVLMRVTRSAERCEIYEPACCATRSMGKKLLKALAVETGDSDMAKWRVVLYQGRSSGVPQQTDARSCGAFLCVIAAHLLKDAAFPDIQVNITAWRRHIGMRIWREAGASGP